MSSSLLQYQPMGSRRQSAEPLSEATLRRIFATKRLFVVLPLTLFTSTAVEAQVHMAVMDQPISSRERQITTSQCGHILTHARPWSADGQWIVYDVRSDPAGSVFDGTRIERVRASDGVTELLFKSERGACCGVALYSPVADEVVFILGPENPTDDWQYGPAHRQGAIVRADRPLVASNLDARDVEPPFTPGALRGGSHVHVYSRDGKYVSFTYEDHILARRDESLGLDRAAATGELNQRNVGVSTRGKAVWPSGSHPRNCAGDSFSVLVTKTVNLPRPGVDEICKAYDEAWIGNAGYVRGDGTRQERAIAFLGDLITSDGRKITELFVVDLPNDLSVLGDAPLEGTSTTRPAPPSGTHQRRLTHTASRRYPGLQGPRQWPASSPDGSQIAYLMRDDAGIVQLWTISPNGGMPRQATQLPFDVASAFSWHPDGKHIAFAADNSIWLLTVDSGLSQRLTERTSDDTRPRPEACAFSPDGRQIAFVRPVKYGSQFFNQVFVTTLDDRTLSAVRGRNGSSP